MVKKWIFAAPMLIIFSVLWLPTAARAQKKNDNEKKAGELKTVESVDLKRYAGTWYEIARYPNRFQKQCVGNTTATYSLEAGGDLQVINKCLKKDGKIDDAKGKAKIVDEQTNAKLKVSFFAFFYAPYWIIDLDKDYQYAVVGHPDRKYLWILSRAPEMKDATYQNILRRIEALGYNPAKLEKTSQNVEMVKGSVVQKQ